MWVPLYPHSSFPTTSFKVSRLALFRWPHRSKTAIYGQGPDRAKARRQSQTRPGRGGSGHINKEKSIRPVRNFNSASFTTRRKDHSDFICLIMQGATKQNLRFSSRILRAAFLLSFPWVAFGFEEWLLPQWALAWGLLQPVRRH